MRPSSTTPIPLNKRSISTLVAAVGLVLLLFISLRQPSSLPPSTPPPQSPSPIHDAPIVPEILQGGVISSKIENATAKAELGRAGWKLFHTTMAKFPDKPTQEEQTALFSYIHLFARLYPCGECAEHFQKILQKYPPQVSTRSNAAAWACHVHNVVNRNLEKDEFDCSKIGDFYDCGCADDDKKEKGGDKTERSKGSGKIDLSIERNGPTPGG